MTALPEAAEALRRLGERGWTIGVAESLTGGLLISSLIDVPGASAHVRGGVIAYATDLKHTVLGVDASLLAAHGPVHPEVARQMAEGVRTVTGHGGVRTDVGIATTGVAGPDPQGGQPVGTVHIGVSTPKGARVVSLRLGGGRDEIRQAAVRHALQAVVEAI